MNRIIIMSGDHIAAFSDQTKALQHRHWMMQIFLGLSGSLNLQVEGTKLSATWILVDTNKEHQLSANNGTHFTMLIEPTSSLAKNLKRQYLKDESSFAILDKYALPLAQQACSKFLETKDPNAYTGLIIELYKLLTIEIKASQYDPRITSLLQNLDTCDCTEHSVGCLADAMHLSASRLAHLFRNETGIPLKSYMVLHKLEKAYEILLYGSTSITDAAMQSGFNSPSHFAAMSKAMMGMAASDILKDSEFLKVQQFIRV